MKRVRATYDTPLVLLVACFALDSHRRRRWPSAWARSRTGT
jgi:hypothetical protein